MSVRVTLKHFEMVNISVREAIPLYKFLNFQKFQEHREVHLMKSHLHTKNNDLHDTMPGQTRYHPVTSFFNEDTQCFTFLYFVCTGNSL